jgi:hypothetical protein
LVVALLAGADATVEYPKWILGVAAKSCAETCAANQRHCIGGYWPTDVRMVLNISAKSGSSTTCVDVKRQLTTNTFNYPPAIKPATGECQYQPSIAYITCAAAPPTGWQRYCPCSTLAPQFMVAGEGQSCDVFCRSRGGVCSGDAGLWPTDQAGVIAMAQPLGMSCAGTVNPVSTPPYHAPSINGDQCYRPEDNGKVSCSAAVAAYRRFCPCLGASMFAQSSTSGGGSGSTSGTGTNSGNAQNSRFPGRGGQGPCRGGSFKIGEGTGGTKRRVPGGLQVQNETECRQRVNQYCPEANGATYNHASKDCWCEIDMTGYTRTVGNTVCWFTSGVTTVGSTGVMSAFEQHAVSVRTSGSVTIITGGGAILCAVLSLMVWYKTSSRRVQADEHFAAINRIEEAD